MNDFIKEHWENRCKTHKDSHWVSFGDENAINLEIDAISKHIKYGDIVLDAGCANGFSTKKQAHHHNYSYFYAIDYCESMIDIAKEKNYNNIIFKVGNILDLEFENNFFDVTYTTRCLINIPNWKAQKQAFNELYRVTKTGGKIIISEAFWEPLCFLNSLRILFSLKPLIENDFNRYLKKEKFENFLKEKKLSFINEDFSALYYIGSRCLREVFTSFTEYDNPFNGVFYDLEKSCFYDLEKVYSGYGAGVLQLYAIDKE